MVSIMAAVPNHVLQLQVCFAPSRVLLFFLLASVLSELMLLRKLTELQLFHDALTRFCSEKVVGGGDHCLQSRISLYSLGEEKLKVSPDLLDCIHFSTQT